MASDTNKVALQVALERHSAADDEKACESHRFQGLLAEYIYSSRRIEWIFDRLILAASSQVVALMTTMTVKRGKYPLEKEVT